MSTIDTRRVAMTLPIKICTDGSCRTLSVPWVSSLDTYEANAVGAAVLSSNLGNFAAGLYVEYKGQWWFALGYTDVSNILAAAVTIIVNPSGEEDYTTTKLYASGKLQAGTVVPIGGKDIYVSIEEDTIGGGGSTVRIGSVTTGLPGSAAVVVNSGSAEAAILDFIIPRGNPGVQGVQGVRGPIGQTGRQGDPGAPGIQGVQGVPGEQGIQGIQGVQGDQGPQGVKGDKGDRGVPGPQGDLGPKGDKGEPGPRGDQGDLGPKGDKGDQGDLGPKGDPGPQGNPGPAASISIGTVVSGSVGGLPTVTNSGTPSEAIFDFVIPKGEMVVPEISSTAVSGNINPTTVVFTEIATASGITRVLPTPSLVFKGYMVNLKNSSLGSMTITGNVDANTKPSLNVSAGTSLQFHCDGTTWWLL